MGIRLNQFKKGGGFLDGVDGVINDYSFTDAFNGQPYTEGKISFVDPKSKKMKTIDRPHSLNCVLSVRVDGAEEDTTTTLKVAGDYDAFEVSDDGKVLTAADGGPCAISDQSGLAKFIYSLCTASEGKFSDSRFEDDVNKIDIRPILGTRVRFKQRVDTERTAEFGKKVDKKGKEWDRKDLTVETVYATPEEGEKVTKQAKASAKTVTKAAGGKPNGKAVTVDVPSLAGEALVEMLTKAGRPLAKQKLNMLTLTTPSLKGSPVRDDVRTYLFNDDNLDALAEVGLISYDRVDGIITLAEA